MKGEKIARHSTVGAGLSAAILALSVVSLSVQAQDTSASGANQRMTAAANSDTASKVKSALNSNPTFDGRHVDVAMDKGSVVLSGFVQSSNAVQDATRIATQAAGNHKVVNHLTVQQNYPNAP